MLEDLVTLPGAVEIILRHPQLAVDLARRLTYAPIPPPACTVVQLLGSPALMRVRLGGAQAHAAVVGIFTRQQRPARPDRAPLTITVAALDGHCQLSYQLGHEEQDALFADRSPEEVPEAATARAPVDIGPDVSGQLADGGPWMEIFAAVTGASNLVDRQISDSLLAAIDATGGTPAGIVALTTVVMRAQTEQLRAELELRMGTRSFRPYLTDRNFSVGYAHGLQRGRRETAIVMLLTERGIALSDRQRRLIAGCDDSDRLARWFSRAIRAKTAEEVLAA